MDCHGNLASQRHPPSFLALAASVACFALISCVQPSRATPSADKMATSSSRVDAQPKTLTMAFEVFPSSPGGKLRGGGRGNVVLHWFWNGYLTGLDERGKATPILAT